MNRYKSFLLLIFSLIVFGTQAFAQRDLLDAPIILQPYNGTRIQPLQPQFMVFIWTSLGSVRFPGYVGYVRYKFELVDMTENNLANPEDAFRSMAVRPYYVEDNILSPNLLYNMSKPPLQVGRKYAVRITAYSIESLFEFRNGGASPVIVFTYGASPDENTTGEVKVITRTKKEKEKPDYETPQP